MRVELVTLVSSRYDDFNVLHVISVFSRIILKQLTTVLKVSHFCWRAIEIVSLGRWVLLRECNDSTSMKLFVLLELVTSNTWSRANAQKS